MQCWTKIDAERLNTTGRKQFPSYQCIIPCITPKGILAEHKWWKAVRLLPGGSVRPATSGKPQVGGKTTGQYYEERLVLARRSLGSQQQQWDNNIIDGECLFSCKSWQVCCAPASCAGRRIVGCLVRVNSHLPAGYYHFNHFCNV